MTRKKNPKIKNDKKVMDIFDKWLAAYEQPFKLMAMGHEQVHNFTKKINKCRAGED